MTDVSQLPTWAVYAVAFGTPASAFLGVLINGWLNRRGARELESRSKREEVMRLLRWASELAVSEDEREAALGVDQLIALADSDILGDSEKAFVDAALESALAEPVEEIAEIEAAGEEPEIVQDEGDGSRASPELASDEQPEGPT